MMFKRNKEREVIQYTKLFCSVLKHSCQTAMGDKSKLNVVYNYSVIGINDLK